MKRTFGRYVVSESVLRKSWDEAEKFGREGGNSKDYGNSRIECRAFDVPDDLWQAIMYEPWDYRDRWLKLVTKTVHKLRKKGLMNWLGTQKPS